MSPGIKVRPSPQRFLCIPDHCVQAPHFLQYLRQDPASILIQRFCLWTGGCGPAFTALRHDTDAPFTKLFLHTLDGVAFFIEKVADPAHKLDIFGAVISAAPAAFQLLDLRVFLSYDMTYV